MTTFGEELLQSVREARAIARGEMEPARVLHPPTVNVRAIRKRMKLSQTAFADRFGLSIGAVRDWEQNRRSPDRPARILLAVIEREPEAVIRALDSDALRSGV